MNDVWSKFTIQHPEINFKFHQSVSCWFFDNNLEPAKLQITSSDVRYFSNMPLLNVGGILTEVDAACQGYVMELKPEDRVKVLEKRVTAGQHATCTSQMSQTLSRKSRSWCSATQSIVIYYISTRFLRISPNFKLVLSNGIHVWVGSKRPGINPRGR